MRKPDYLSPSSVSCYLQNPEEYYKRYLSDQKPGREPQTLPMSVGSSFDAFIKSYLHEKLFGKNHPESDKYSLDALLESQIDLPNRAWARIQGKYIFGRYVKFGGAERLLADLEKAVDEPRFEFDLKGTLKVPNGMESKYQNESVEKRILGIPILGKPDLRFINSSGAHVIVDFKVNGYCSNAGYSPMAGYIRCIDGWSYLEHKEVTKTTTHRDCVLGEVDGIQINTNGYLERYNEDWARQLSTYGWLLGENVGSEIINAIEQVVAYKQDAITEENRRYPAVRFASHRLRTSRNFQFIAFQQYLDLWSLVNSDPFYFFRDVSFEDSKLRCEILDKQSQLTDPDSKWITELAKPRY